MKILLLTLTLILSAQAAQPSAKLCKFYAEKRKEYNSILLQSPRKTEYTKSAINYYSTKLYACNSK